MANSPRFTEATAIRCVIEVVPLSMGKPAGSGSREHAAARSVAGSLSPQEVSAKQDVACSLAYGGPIPLSAEGVHSLAFHSTDRSQNVEVAQVVEVSIDKTAREAVISYDPFADDIVVTGQDAMSGFESGAVPVSSPTPTTWTDSAPTWPIYGNTGSVTAPTTRPSS